MSDGNGIALVTGAGGGIGAACASGLAEAGWDVHLVGRNRDRLLPVADAVRDLGREAEVHACDVTDPVAVEGLIAGLDRLDTLVNAAGGNVPQAFVEVQPDTLEELFSVNVNGTFFASQSAARKMIERGEGGVIVNVSSQMGHIGAANRTVYCATKHAIEGLTKALAVELAPHEIRVNSVAPTYVRTPMTEPFFEDEAFLEASLAKIPLNRLGEPSDVAAAVSYLVSPGARMVTGTSLLIDGGYTAQ